MSSVQEAKQDAQELEAEITDLLREYEEKHDVNVERARLVREDLTNGQSQLVGINLRVEL